MKKALLLVLLLLFGGIAVLGGSIWYQMDVYNYQADIVKYAGAAQADEGIQVVYKGQTIRILGSNIDQLVWALTIGEKERKLQLFDRKTPYESMAISFGKDLLVTVCPGDEKGDKVFIRFQAPGKTRYYTLEGYDTMTWLQKITSPEGYWEPNELKETKV